MKIDILFHQYFIYKYVINCFILQYETEEQDQKMTDVKLQNEKDRIDLGNYSFVAKRINDSFIKCNMFGSDYNITIWFCV